MRRTCLAMLVLVGCAHDYVRPEDPARAWMYDRGAAARSITPCLAIASALRAECKGDRGCERRVSEDVSFDCYAGSYRNGGATPCGAPADACATAGLPPALLAHCDAELRVYREDICLRGNPTLTGAGP